MSVIYVDTSKSGLILSDESREWLSKNATVLPQAGGDGADLLDKLDLRGLVSQDDQRRQGSCQGQSLTKNLEGLYWQATGGYLELSRQFAYVGSQRESGIRGDSGSTISGGIRRAKKGLCRELLWPYPDRYQTQGPNSWADCEEDAANYRLVGHTPIRSYDEALLHLRSKRGFIHTGFMWSGSLDEEVARTGRVTRFRPGGGGHSVPFLCFDFDDLDDDGKPYLWLQNSWSSRWGQNGWTKVSSDWFDAMCNHRYSEVAGLYGIELGPDAVLPSVF